MTISCSSSATRWAGRLRCGPSTQCRPRWNTCQLESAGKCSVIDTRDVADVRGDVERAHTQAPHAVVLVFTVAEAEKQIGAAVKGSNVFAVLPIPVDKRKTGAVLEGAMADAIARKSSRAIVERSRPNVSVESFQPAASGEPPEASSKGKMGLVLGVIVVVAAAAGGSYMYLNKGKQGPAPAAALTKAAASAAAPGAATQAE